MMGFIKKIKSVLTLTDRIFSLEQQIGELDTIFKNSLVEYSKKFEKKIQDMSFAYTKNLDDAKSDYLKRYIDQRLNGMQYDITQLPERINLLSDQVNFFAEKYLEAGDNK